MKNALAFCEGPYKHGTSSWNIANNYSKFILLSPSLISVKKILFRPSGLILNHPLKSELLIFI